MYVYNMIKTVCSGLLSACLCDACIIIEHMVI